MNLETSQENCLSSQAPKTRLTSTIIFGNLTMEFLVFIFLFLLFGLMEKFQKQITSALGIIAMKLINPNKIKNLRDIVKHRKSIETLGFIFSIILIIFFIVSTVLIFKL